MAEREVVLDPPVVLDQENLALQQATERAERAEAELARLKTNNPRMAEPASANPSPSGQHTSGEQELRKDSMMAHLLDSLDAGKDIGHYGRLVFSMVARHFLPHEEVLCKLTQDRDFSVEQANLMLRQVEGRDYNPPRRDRILEWQAQQDFPYPPLPG